MKPNLNKIFRIFLGLILGTITSSILFFFFPSYLSLNKEVVSLKSEITEHTERLKGCKEYSLFKQATLKVGRRTYDLEKYNCIDFSKDLVKELKKVGIKSNIAISEDRTHAWVLVWIETTTGEFIPPETDLGILELRDEEMNVICE